MPKEYALRLMQEAGAVPGGENHAVYDCNGLHIHMQYAEDSDTLLLYVHLGFLPEHSALKTCEYLLELNFLGAALGGGHVGLHKRTRALAHSLRLEAARQSVQSLQNALHLFAGHTLELLEKKHTGRVAAGKETLETRETREMNEAGETGETGKTGAGQTKKPAVLPKAGAAAAVTGRGVMWG